MSSNVSTALKKHLITKLNSMKKNRKYPKTWKIQKIEKMKIFFSYDTTLNVSTVLNNHLTAKVNFMKIIDEKKWKCFLDSKLL